MFFKNCFSQFCDWNFIWLPIEYKEGMKNKERTNTGDDKIKYLENIISEIRPK